MKTLNEVKQRPDDWLGTTIRDLQDFATSVRPSESTGSLVVHTQDGVIVEPDPLFGLGNGISGGDRGPARWA